MTSLRMLALAGAAAGALALSAASAHASQVFFSDETSFLTAAGPVATEDFEDTTLLPGLTIDSTVGTIGGGLFNDQVVDPTQTSTFDLGHAAKAWGGFFDLTPNGFGSGIAFTITLLDNSTITLTQQVANVGPGAFFGFASSQAFTKVTLIQGSAPGVETYSLDDMSFNSASVPEPTAWTLMLAGFAGLGLAMRRRRSLLAA